MFDFISTSCVAKMIILECMYIRQSVDLLQGLIPNSEEQSKQLSKQHLGKLFIFTLMWSLGALLELEDRAKMEEFLKNQNVNAALPPIKDDETIFEYFVSLNIYIVS